jgi:hypothetical protein
MLIFCSCGDSSRAKPLSNFDSDNSATEDAQSSNKFGERQIDKIGCASPNGGASWQ